MRVSGTFCKPGDSRLSDLLKRLEQGSQLERRMENGKKERVYVLEEGVPITKSEFQSPGEQHGKGVGEDAGSL